MPLYFAIFSREACVRLHLCNAHTWLLGSSQRCRLGIGTARCPHGIARAPTSLLISASSRRCFVFSAGRLNVRWRRHQSSSVRCRVWAWICSTSLVGPRFDVFVAALSSLVRSRLGRAAPYRPCCWPCLRHLLSASPADCSNLFSISKNYHLRDFRDERELRQITNRSPNTKIF